MGGRWSRVALAVGMLLAACGAAAALPVPGADAVPAPAALEAHSAGAAVPSLLQGLLRAPPPPEAPAPEPPAAPAAPPAPSPPAAPAPPSAPALPAAGGSVGASAPGLLDALPPLLAPEPQDGGVPALPGPQPRLPSAPPSPAGPAPSTPALPAAPGAPGVGTSTVALDAGQPRPLGGALQRWADEAAPYAAAWFGGGGPEARQALSALVALALSGLATLLLYSTGFRHVRGDNLLEHAVRHQALALVRERPGMHLRAIARELGLSPTNAAYHLRILERHGLVRGEMRRGRKLFIAATGPEHRAALLARGEVLQPRRAAVLRAVAVEPDANQSAVAARAGQLQGAVGWHLRRLVEAGLVAEHRTPRECRYRLTAMGREVHAALAPPAAPGAEPAHAARATNVLAP